MSMRPCPVCKATGRDEKHCSCGGATVRMPTPCMICVPAPTQRPAGVGALQIGLSRSGGASVPLSAGQPTEPNKGPPDRRPKTTTSPRQRAHCANATHNGDRFASVSSPSRSFKSMLSCSSDLRFPSCAGICPAQFGEGQRRKPAGKARMSSRFWRGGSMRLKRVEPEAKLNKASRKYGVLESNFLRHRGGAKYCVCRDFGAADCTRFMKNKCGWSHGGEDGLCPPPPHTVCACHWYGVTR